MLARLLTRDSGEFTRGRLWPRAPEVAVEVRQGKFGLRNSAKRLSLTERPFANYVVPSGVGCRGGGGSSTVNDHTKDDVCTTGLGECNIMIVIYTA